MWPSHRWACGMHPSLDTHVKKLLGQIENVAVPETVWNNKASQTLISWTETKTLITIIIIIIYPLTAKVVQAPQMIPQPASSIVPCSPLASGTWRTPGLSIPWCCLPTSSSVCLVFFPLSLCLARWFWPDTMNQRHDHTTAVASLYDVKRSSCVPTACWILAPTSSLVTWSLYEMRSILQ